MIQWSRRERSPQGASEIAVVSWAPGIHPKGFKTDFESKYILTPCTQKRKFSVIDNIPDTKNKLKLPGTKKPVLVEEKSTSLIPRVMPTFCTKDRRILDPYAGRMTTAISCMCSRCPCTVIEKDIRCYRLAVSRLEAIGARNLDVLNSRQTRERTARGVVDLFLQEMQTEGGEDEDSSDEDDAPAEEGEDTYVDAESNGGHVAGQTD